MLFDFVMQSIFFGKTGVAERALINKPYLCLLWEWKKTKGMSTMKVYTTIR